MPFLHLPGFSTADDLVLGHLGRLPLLPTYRVSARYRTGHMYVVGRTGMGKSFFLLSCILQDILAGRGVAVIDPHSDLISDVLSILAQRGFFSNQHNAAKIIYLDPSAQSHTIPFNVLAGGAAPYEIAQNTIEAFRRTWSESLSVAPNFDNNMLHALILLLKTRRRLTDLPALWLNSEFREALLAQASDPQLTAFFTQRFARWGRDATLKIESLLNKATALTMNPYLALMLGQQRNHLNFRHIMDNGLVLLADLGGCDEESQRLIGNLITTGLEQAVFSRRSVPQSARRPFYTYIDEFQDFSAGDGSTKTFSKILSGARKLGLHLTLAHQNMSQLSKRMKGAIIGNVWTKVIFSISEDDALDLAQVVALGNIDPRAEKHAAQTESQHPLYTPLQEHWYGWASALANQKPRQATVRNFAGKTSRIWTLPVPKGRIPTHHIRQQSMARYGIPTDQARQHIHAVQKQQTGEVLLNADIASYEPVIA